jgi:hypothetical protein
MGKSPGMARFHETALKRAKEVSGSGGGFSDSFPAMFARETSYDDGRQKS